MANSVVRLPVGYFPDPKVGRPLFNAKIYVGIIDLNPRIVANQKDVTGRQEDGTEVSIAQPVRTSAGGVPIDDNGNIVTLLVDGAYAMAVDDRNDNQKYFFDNVLAGEPITFDNLGTYASLTFNTIADLKTGTLADGSTVVRSVGDTGDTLGYTTVNDRGDGKYFISESTGVDDGGLRIDLTDGSGLQAQLIKGDELNLRQFGGFGTYTDDDSISFINMLLAYEETKIPVYAPHGAYNISQSIDLPDGLVMRGDGAPIIATFPQFGGDKSLLRPGFKDQISGTSFIFTAVTKSYTTTRSDRYSTQTYAMASLTIGPLQLSGFAIIQDMDVLDAGGTLTTAANINKAAIGVGLVTQSTLSKHTDITIFGYFDNAGLIIHNPLTTIDPEYNRFLSCNISGGTAIIGNDTAGGAANGGITGMTFIDTGLYGSDNHTRADGDYTISAIFMDGFLLGGQEAIRGQLFTGCNVRTYANKAISTDHIDDFGFSNCVTEFPTLAGVTNADENGGFFGTANTKNFRAFNLAATSDLKMGAYLAIITGKFQVMGAGIFDNAMFGESGSGVRMLASSGSGNSIIQLTDDFTSTATGWSIVKDVASGDRFELRFNNVTSISLDKDGGWASQFGLANGGTKTIAAGVITLTLNSYFSVDTEAAAATDDLDRIDGGAYDGQIIIIKSTVTGRDVTVKDTAAGGNIRCAGDFILSNPQDRMQLMFDGTNWCELSRADNTA